MKIESLKELKLNLIIIKCKRDFFLFERLQTSQVNQMASRKILIKKMLKYCSFFKLKTFYSLQMKHQSKLDLLNLFFQRFRSSFLAILSYYQIKYDETIHTTGASS